MIKGILKNEISRGSLGSFIINIGNILLGFLVGIILARYLGPDSFGHYAYVLALISLLAVPTELGLPNLLIKYISIYVDNKNWTLVKGLLFWTNILVSVFSLVIIITAIFYIKNGGEINSEERKFTIYFGLLLLPFMALIETKGGALIGLKEITLGKLPSKIIRQGLLIVFLIVAFVTNYQIDAKIAMAFHSVSAILTFVLITFWLNRKLPAEVIESERKFDQREWFKVALPLMIIGGMSVLNSRIDIVMMGWFRSASEVGLYEVAVKGGGIITVSLLAFNIALAPHFPSLHAKNEISKLQKLVSKYVSIAVAIALPILVIFSIWGDSILSFVFGIEYREAYVALVLISLGQFIHVCAGSVGILLKMIGYQNIVLKIVGCTTLINVILNYLLIPIYGMEGAAVASIITYFIWNIILVIWSIKKLDIDTSIFSIFYRI